MHSIMSKNINELVNDTSLSSGSEQISSYQIIQAIPSFESSQQALKRILINTNKGTLNKTAALSHFCFNTKNFILLLD